jgi:hypothetical protein
MVLRHYFLSVPRFPPAAVILSKLRAYPDLHVALAGKTNEGSLKTFEKNIPFSEIGEPSIEKYFDLVFEGLNSFYCFVRTFSHTIVARSHARFSLLLE